MQVCLSMPVIWLIGLMDLERSSLSGGVEFHGTIDAFYFVILLVVWKCGVAE